MHSAVAEYDLQLDWLGRIIWKNRIQLWRWNQLHLSRRTDIGQDVEPVIGIGIGIGTGREIGIAIEIGIGSISL